MKKFKIEKNSLLNKIIVLPKFLELLKKYNSLEAENENLKDNIKNQLYIDKTKTMELEQMVESLNNDNKRLREKIKTLKARL